MQNPFKKAMIRNSKNSLKAGKVDGPLDPKLQRPNPGGPSSELPAAN